MNHSTIVTICFGSFTLTAHAEKPCPFNSTTNTYQGERAAQARCLLRQVKRFGILSTETPLPSTLETLLSKNSIDISIDDFKHYLVKSNISENEIGGELSKSPNPKTRYFIIHDTSTPNFGSNSIPENINNKSWNGNNLNSYTPNAHVYINRLGESLTKVTISENHRTTKFELLDNNRRNVYIGVELIQPRRSYPDGSSKNDATAPTPGFTESQMERLATVYLAASVRAGNYLVPAFHAVVDAGLSNGHDDPQNFDLEAWASALKKVIGQVNTRTTEDLPTMPEAANVVTVAECDDYASWRIANKDCSWTKAAEEAAAISSLSTLNPSDVSSFCPKYSELATQQRNMFWVALLSAMTRPESNYKPELTYTEKFKDGSGKKVISRGLLQISIESANQKRYSCGIKNAKELHDSPTNLSCGIKILEAWVVNDNIIASYNKDIFRGGGRYWSVLRKSNNHLPEIMNNTSSLSFCKK